jgi:hypothetical protein
MSQDAFRNRAALPMPRAHTAGGTRSRDSAQQGHESPPKVIAARGEVLKPLPAGTRLRKACVCGRRIPAHESLGLVDPDPCPECGSILRAWERQRAGPVARMIAWVELYRWKKRRLSK